MTRANRRRSTIGLFAVATLALIVGLSSRCTATDLRGQVLTVVPGGAVPMPQALVELFIVGVLRPPTISDINGTGRHVLLSKRESRTIPDLG